MRASALPISTAARTAPRSPALPRQGIFHTGFAGIEAADRFLLIAPNPRWEAPVLNAAHPKVWTGGNVRIANVGELTI